MQEELEQARDREIVTQLEELKRLDHKAAQHLDLRPERLRDVVNLGLQLARVPELRARAEPPGSYDVPLDEVSGTDATWKDILDSLRPPRTRKMPEWEWRAKSPPRPVSFEPSTTLSSPTVQLHLQHKLTQRALAQFRSQSFGEDQLSRLTVLIDPDPRYRRNRILALGRLSLYGPGASRLHEEVISVAAIWSEGEPIEAFKTAEAEENAIESFSAGARAPRDPRGLGGHREEGRRRRGEGRRGLVGDPQEEGHDPHLLGGRQAPPARPREATEIAIRPDAHMRSSDMPATASENPAAAAVRRPIL